MDPRTLSSWRYQVQKSPSFSTLTLKSNRNLVNICGVFCWHRNWLARKLHIFTICLIILTYSNHKLFAFYTVFCSIVGLIFTYWNYFRPSDWCCTYQAFVKYVFWKFQVLVCSVLLIQFYFLISQRRRILLTSLKNWIFLQRISTIYQELFQLLSKFKLETFEK